MSFAGSSAGEPPRRTAKAEAARQARQAREAAALRENLRRRKEQARAAIKPAESDASAKPR